jgi:hypothetical protein
VCGIRSVIHRLVDFGLGDVVLSAEVGDLGAEGVCCLVKPGNVDWDDCVNVRKGSGHFPNFFEDDVVG